MSNFFAAQWIWHQTTDLQNMSFNRTGTLVIINIFKIMFYPPNLHFYYHFQFVHMEE